MTSPLTRRPMPALIALLALLVLTALVWWRVLHRSDAGTTSTTCATPTPTATVTKLPAPSSITVQVLNATNRTGIAGKARTTLVDDGFKVPSLAGNDTANKGKVPEVAQIRYGPKGADGARLLGYYLPGARLVPNHGTSATVVVSLGTKYTTVAAPSTVQAALAKAHLAVASSAPGPQPSITC